jgi:hypothetical protein
MLSGNPQQGATAVQTEQVQRMKENKRMGPTL